MLSQLFFFLLGISMEQFLLMHWAFDLFFTAVVPSLKRCSSFLLSDVMVLLLILTFTTSFPEKTI